MLYFQVVALVVLILSVPVYLTGKSQIRFINSSLLLAVIFTIYYFLSQHTQGSSTHFKTCLFTLLTAIPFYTGTFKEKQVRSFFWLLSIAGFFAFYHQLSHMRNVNENYYGGGYFVLVCLPLGLYNLRNSKIQLKLVWFLIVFACVLISLKRGDILAMFLSTIVYFASLFIQNQKRLQLKNLFLIGMSVCVFTYFANNFFLGSELAQERIEETIEGNSSKRDIIYAFYYKQFVNSDIGTKIIGNGFSATEMSIMKIAAHNDWLEIAYDEGLIGIVFYLLILISLFLTIKKEEIPSNFRPIIAMVFTIVLVKSAISMMVFSLPTTALFALIGYMLNPKTLQNNNIELL